MSDVPAMCSMNMKSSEVKTNKALSESFDFRFSVIGVI